MQSAKSNAIRSNKFFSMGLFARKRIATLVVACVFACYALCAFCFAMTLLLTDPERAAFRTCYAHGITEIEIQAIETDFDSIHGFNCSRRTFSERQIQALNEYAGDSLVIKSNGYTASATFALSGDKRKDNKLIKSMRHTRTGKANKKYRVGFKVSNDFVPYITFDGSHTGVILANRESILLFLSVIPASVTAAVLSVKRRKRLSENADGASAKTFILQGLFLTAVIFAAALLFAYIGILIINSVPYPYWKEDGTALTNFVVPEPISAISTLALGAALILPAATKGKKAKT